jgi:hypothetical protein
MAKGPGPYVNTVPAEGMDPIVKTVPFAYSAIGASPAGLPPGTRNGGMGLQHYGTTTDGNPGKQAP